MFSNVVVSIILFLWNKTKFHEEFVKLNESLTKKSAVNVLLL